MSDIVILGCLSFAMLLVLSGLARNWRLAVMAIGALTAFICLLLPTGGHNFATAYVALFGVVVAVSTGLFELVATFSRKLTKRAVHG